MTVCGNSLHEKQIFFDSAAEGWDALFDETKRPILDHIVSVIKSRLGTNELILDAGCGTGLLFRYFSGYPHVALDLSFKMLRKANTAKTGSCRGIIQADAHLLPFKNYSFGHVIFLAVLPHFEYKSIALREAYRILYRGGSLSIVHLIPPLLVNAVHASAGGVIAGDILPDKKMLLKLMVDEHFSIDHVEYGEFVFLLGRK